MDLSRTVELGESTHTFQAGVPTRLVRFPLVSSTVAPTFIVRSDLPPRSSFHYTFPHMFLLRRFRPRFSSFFFSPDP